MDATLRSEAAASSQLAYPYHQHWAQHNKEWKWGTKNHKNISELTSYIFHLSLKNEFPNCLFFFSTYTSNYEASKLYPDLCAHFADVRKHLSFQLHFKSILNSPQFLFVWHSYMTLDEYMHNTTVRWQEVRRDHSTRSEFKQAASTQQSLNPLCHSLKHDVHFLTNGRQWKTRDIIMSIQELTRPAVPLSAPS